MDEQDRLARQFEEHRTHLRAVAYRMLGSVSEADDAVQEAWLRASRADTSEVENLRAWLTTVVARVSLSMLRSRKAKREEPLAVHVPEPLVASLLGIRGAFAVSGAILSMTALVCIAFLGRAPGEPTRKRVAFASANGARPQENGDRSLTPSRTER